MWDQQPHPGSPLFVEMPLPRMSGIHLLPRARMPTIMLSSMGSNMNTSPRLQLFNTTSCTVATLNANSNNCVSGTSVTSLNLTPSTALTIGTTYLVRVFTNGNNVTATPSSTWNFNICVVDAAPANDACCRRNLTDFRTHLCQYGRHALFSYCYSQHLCILWKHHFARCLVFICCTNDLADHFTEQYGNQHG